MIQQNAQLQMDVIFKEKNAYPAPLYLERVQPIRTNVNATVHVDTEHQQMIAQRAIAT